MKNKNKKRRSGDPIVTAFASGGTILGSFIGMFTNDFVYSAIIFLGLGVLIGAIVSVLSEKKKRRKIAAAEKAEIAAVDKPKFDAVANRMKELTASKAYRIRLEKSELTGLTDSKFGGLPYWSRGMEYPRSKKGEPLVLLAQINFDRERLNDSRLPKTGILQFFVECDDLTGADFEDPTSQNGFRVIYHPETDKTVTENYVRTLGVKTMAELEEDCYPPFDCQYAVKFEEFEDHTDTSVYDFDELFCRVLYDMYGETAVEGTVWKTLNNSEFDYFTKQFDSWGHKMLGYPAFTQCDPRENEAYARFDTLLLQIDSQDDIMWGDCGVANFFIPSEKLKALDFSDVLYNWDCY